MNKRGFTLMEILAVLLTLAVVTSLALPGIRAIRAEIYHYRAKAAASKMADAARSFFRDSRGYTPGIGAICARAGDPACPSNGKTVKEAVGTNCKYRGMDGIPSRGMGSSVHVDQLFACKYLSQKDFVGLPYKFTVLNVAVVSVGELVVTATGTSGAGRYEGTKICVYLDGSIKEGC